MTVEQMETNMSYAELVEWQALDLIRMDERDRAARQAKKGMKPRKRRRR